MQDGVANSYRLDTDEGRLQFVDDSQKHEGELGVGSTWEIQTEETKQHVQGSEVCGSMGHLWTHRYCVLLEHKVCRREGGRRCKESRQVVRNRSWFCDQPFQRHCVTQNCEAKMKPKQKPSYTN